jgi:hypothetical protein
MKNMISEEMIKKGKPFLLSPFPLFPFQPGRPGQPSWRGPAVRAAPPFSRSAQLANPAQPASFSPLFFSPRRGPASPWPSCPPRFGPVAAQPPQPARPLSPRLESRRRLWVGPTRQPRPPQTASPFPLSSPARPRSSALVRRRSPARPSSLAAGAPPARGKPRPLPFFLPSLLPSLPLPGAIPPARHPRGPALGARGHGVRGHGAASRCRPAPPDDPPLSPPSGDARPRPWRRPGAAPTGSPAPPLGVASRGGAASPAPARAPPASPRPAGLARSRCPALPGQGRRSRSPARGPVPATARSPARGHGAVARRGPVSPVGARRALPGRSWHGDPRPRRCVRSPGAARARTVPPASSPHPRLAATAARSRPHWRVPPLRSAAPARRSFSSRGRGAPA